MLEMIAQAKRNLEIYARNLRGFPSRFPVTHYDGWRLATFPTIWVSWSWTSPQKSPELFHRFWLKKNMFARRDGGMDDLQTKCMDVIKTRKWHSRKYWLINSDHQECL